MSPARTILEQIEKAIAQERKLKAGNVWMKLRMSRENALAIGGTDAKTHEILAARGWTLSYPQDFNGVELEIKDLVPPITVEFKYGPEDT